MSKENNENIKDNRELSEANKIAEKEKEEALRKNGETFKFLYWE